MLFNHCKQVAQELLALIRVSSLLPRSSTTLSPLLARRLEAYIAKKEISEAGVLADFVSNIVESSLEEKLRILAALDVKERLQQVIELVSRQIDGMKGTIKITTITSSTPKKGLNISGISRKDRDSLIRQAMSGVGRFNPMGVMPPGAGGEGGDEEEPNELEELKTKIDQAKMTAEAQKVADRELKRLKKMNPAQAEYGVCRTYIENLTEIPWTAATEDNLGIETLKRARKQLDDDHYGLQRIKKRLLEYLAVLRLKLAVNADIEAQIAQAKAEVAPQDNDTEQVDHKPSRTDPILDSPKIQILQSKRRVDKSPILLLVGPPGTG